jgi:hypothetical protein
MFDAPPAILMGATTDGAGDVPKAEEWSGGTQSVAVVVDVGPA